MTYKNIKEFLIEYLLWVYLCISIVGYSLYFFNSSFGYIVGYILWASVLFCVDYKLSTHEKIFYYGVMPSVIFLPINVIALLFGTTLLVVKVKIVITIWILFSILLCILNANNNSY